MAEITTFRAVILLSTATIGLAAATIATSPLLSFPDASGLIATYQLDGSRVDLAGPFFQPLSANGRSCSSCHQPAQAWSISAEEVNARFDATQGLDPIFRSHDGANCDQRIQTGTLAGRRSAYSLLRERGLIRMVMHVPASAEFEVTSVRNPYGCDDRRMLSTYRRPLPAANLRFLTSIMWDGRESSPASPAELETALTRQAANAATLHAQSSTPLNARQSAGIVHFEMGIATAQISDHDAGALDGMGARGGPAVLATETIPAFHIGVNDPRQGDPHAVRVEDAIRLYDAWSTAAYGRVYDPHTAPDPHMDPAARRRASIARGQLIFDQQPFDIKGVAGLNDERHAASITGACGTCHNTPGAANHSTVDFMNTGVADTSGPLDVSYLPAIMLRNKATGETRTTTDPGRALITGRWIDIGKVKTPVLRGLPARAPYFHNGSARTLADVVDFYDKRFHIGFSPQQKEDLIAFLSVL